MKKLKNSCHFFNIDRTEKFQMTNPHKVWVSSFPSVNGNRISVLAIMKKLKNGCHFFNIDCTKKFQITDPSQSLGLQFSEWSTEMEYQHWPLWKNWKMAAISLISIVQKNFRLPTPKVWISGFPSVDRNGISVLAIMKKLKNGCHFFNIDRTEKFQITNPKSLDLWFSNCWWKCNISVGHYEKIEKWLPFL